MNGQADSQGKAAMAENIAMMRTLVGVSALAGLLIVLAYQLTLPRIEANRAAALQAAVFAVIPGAQAIARFGIAADGTIAPLEDPRARGARLYAGYSDAGELLGIALEGQGQGYQDVIKIIFGYDPKRQVITGMKVLDSKETPGLGDKIAKDPAFLANFTALDVALDDSGEVLRHAIEVVKNGARHEGWQMDAITGATISSKAIGRILQTSTTEQLPAIRRHLDVIVREGKAP